MNKNEFKLLIVDDIHPVFIESVEKAGIQVDYQPGIQHRQAASVIGDYDGLIVRSKFKVDVPFLDRGLKLKIIGRAGAGVDNIDTVYAESKNIALVSAPEGNCDAVAEHMLGMLLALFNKIIVADAEVRHGQWRREENRGIELTGRTVGLIGYGNNGSAMARKLSGFDVEILAYDKYKTGFGTEVVQEVAMDELFEKADVLSLHIPLTTETRAMVDRDFLQKFKKPIFFLNGARGGIVDIEAILEAIDKKMILGACLDVLPIEKVIEQQKQEWFSKLASLDNVVLTPHVAGWTVESYYKISKVLADKVIAGYQQLQGAS